MTGLRMDTGLKKRKKQTRDSSLLLIKALKIPLSPAGSPEISSSVSQHSISAALFREMCLLKSRPR